MREQGFIPGESAAGTPFMASAGLCRTYAGAANGRPCCYLILHVYLGDNDLSVSTLCVEPAPLEGEVPPKGAERFPIMPPS